MKRYLYDINLWLLLIINIWCIIYYQRNSSEFNSVLWLYWGQSVLIGLFNFLDIITIRPTLTKEKPKYFFNSKGCSAFFFLFHYEFFHLGYAVFIASGTPLDLKFILSALAFFAFNLSLRFMQQKKEQQHSVVNLGRMFFLPYLRIIPMHLMILLPVFLHLKPAIVFLILKTIADLVMYLITSRVYRSQALSSSKEAG